MASSVEMAVELSTARDQSISSIPKPGKQLLDLPAETLKLIFEHFSFHDLSVLCRVSRHVRDLAAAELYQELGHVFRPDLTGIGGFEVDDLAAYLETLATSEYSYASHIKEVWFDTAFAGESGERSAREFSYDHSGGKFMQTLLLAVLKRTQKVEKLYWNTKIELGTGLYQVLSRMPNLRRVHIRGHTGVSLHSSSIFGLAGSGVPPPPPPGAVIVAPPTIHPHPPPPAHGGWTQVPHPSSNIQNIAVVKKLPLARLNPKPKTFSHFKNITSLAAVDLDTFENLTEIAECIKQSLTTLKELKLSISDRYARKARKHSTTDSASEITVSDDDLSENNIPSPPVAEGSQTKLPATPQSHKAAQEAALARMFALAIPTTADKELKKVTSDLVTKASQEMEEIIELRTKVEEDKRFIGTIQDIRRDMRTETTIDNSKHIRATRAKLERAATQYLKKQESADEIVIDKPQPSRKAKRKHPKSSTLPKHPPPNPVPGQVYSFVPVNKASSLSDTLSSIPSQGSSKDSLFLEPEYQSPTAAPANWNKSPTLNIHDYSAPPMPQPETMVISKGPPLPLSSYHGKPGHSLHSKKQPRAKPGRRSRSRSRSRTPPRSPTLSIQIQDPDSLKAKPEVYDDDVDVEHPDPDNDDGEDQEFSSEEEDANDAGNQINGHANGLTPESEPAETSTLKDNPNHSIFSPIPDSSIDTSPSKNKGKAPLHHSKDPPATIPADPLTTYLLTTHGLPLTSLSIALLPVRPSILLRVIDPTTLTSLTLLNTGPQRTLWATLSILHRTSPLPLHSIHSDNPSRALLHFIHALPKNQLRELILLQPGPRAKVPALLAPGTTTSNPMARIHASDIRKLVLLRQLPSLRVLCLRNDANPTWALEVMSVSLLATLGKNLRELGVQTYTAVFHRLSRALPQLPLLRALQVVMLVEPAVQAAGPMNSSVGVQGVPSIHGGGGHGALHPGLVGMGMEEWRHGVMDAVAGAMEDEERGAGGGTGASSFKPDTKLPMAEFEYVGFGAVNAHAASDLGVGPPNVVVSKLWRVWEDIEDSDEEGFVVESDAEAEGGADEEDAEVVEEQNSAAKKPDAAVNGESASASDPKLEDSSANAAASGSTATTTAKDGKAEAASSSRTNGTTSDSKGASKNENKSKSKNSKKRKKELAIWTQDGIKMEHIQHIKMWGKETWAGRL